MSDDEIVRCDCCSCILDSDFTEIELCPNCIDEQQLDDSEYDTDWLDMPTPWLDDNEEDNY